MPQLWGDKRMFLNRIEGCDTVLQSRPSTGWMSGKVPRELTPLSIPLPTGLSKMFFLALPPAPFPDIRSASGGATVSAQGAALGATAWVSGRHFRLGPTQRLQGLPTMKICPPC